MKRLSLLILFVLIISICMFTACAPETPNAAINQLTNNGYDIKSVTDNTIVFNTKIRPEKIDAIAEYYEDENVAIARKTAIEESFAPKLSEYNAKLDELNAKKDVLKENKKNATNDADLQAIEAELDEVQSQIKEVKKDISNKHVVQKKNWVVYGPSLLVDNFFFDTMTFTAIMFGV